MKYSANAECEIKFYMPKAYFIREAYFTLRSNISLVLLGTNFIEKDQVN
ncbi:MAG: hypothetical protein ACI4RB_01600 [Acutalibacteraceae bacterium]